jgi:hypothetical protein
MLDMIRYLRMLCKDVLISRSAFELPYRLLRGLVVVSPSGNTRLEKWLETRLIRGDDDLPISLGASTYD